MILANVRLAGSSGQPEDLRIERGRIVETGALNANDPIRLDLGGALAFPGLINSHDHLDFNLFPQLGNRVYSNYTEWGSHLHQHYGAQINEILKIPLHLRVQWGLYKNLVCGVTTVVNHGEKVQPDDPLIRIHQEVQNIHSVRLDPRWQLRLNNPVKHRLPVVVHAGEGTDPSSREEINRLLNWNLLRRDLVAVHAVAMTPQQARHFKAVVWCPQSNYFLLDKTAPVRAIGRKTPILFGTDSTLTGSWDIWDHIRTARKTGYLTDEELYTSLTRQPAATWSLNCGTLQPGCDADLVVKRDQPGKSFYENFFSTSPADLLLVMHQGAIRLLDPQLITQLPNQALPATYSMVLVQGHPKLVAGNLSELLQQLPVTGLPIQSLKKTYA